MNVVPHSATRHSIHIKLQFSLVSVRLLVRSLCRTFVLPVGFSSGSF